MRHHEAVVSPKRLAREELVEEALRRHHGKLLELQPHAAFINKEARFSSSLFFVVRAHAVTARGAEVLGGRHGRR